MLVVDIGEGIMEMDHVRAVPTQAQFLWDPGVEIGEHL